MSLVSLRYIKGATDATMQFDALKYYAYANKEHLNGRTLRGVEYRHIKSCRNIYEITISADELSDSTKMAFITAFFKAERWFIGSKEVVLDSDDTLKPDYIEDCKLLPEVKLEFIDKYPDDY